MKLSGKELTKQVEDILSPHGFNNPHMVSGIVALLATGHPLTLSKIAGINLMGYVPGQDAETDEAAKELVRGLKRDVPLAESKGLIAKLEELSK
jgi:hypothetical protein